MDLLHIKAQSYKFSNRNDLFCAWRDFNKLHNQNHANTPPSDYKKCLQKKLYLSSLRLNCIEFWAKAKFLGFLIGKRRRELQKFANNAARQF